VLVSHDMRLISQVAKDVWECKDGVRVAASCRCLPPPPLPPPLFTRRRGGALTSLSLPCCVSQSITRFHGGIAEYKAKLKDDILRQEREFERSQAMSSEVKTKVAVAATPAVSAGKAKGAEGKARRGK
jgi:ATPase subunit of ABC transporter with duplicated ATPase domains